MCKDAYQVLDLSHLQCPMTLLVVKQALNELPIGQTVQFLLPNHAAYTDIVKYIQKSNYELVRENTTCLPIVLIIKKS